MKQHRRWNVEHTLVWPLALSAVVVLGCPADDPTPTETGDSSSGATETSESESQSASLTATESASGSTGGPDSETSGSTSTTIGPDTDGSTGTTSTTSPDTDGSTGTDGTTGGEVIGCQGQALVTGGSPGLAPFVSVSRELRPSGAKAASVGDLQAEDDPFMGGGFIDPPPEPVECDIWAQDCPDGEKCMPWANDGGTSWNATRCSPIDPNPSGVGETCTVEGSGVSGVDSCELAAMCWDVDPETNEGTCIAMCTGTPDNPMCDEGTACSISNDGVLILCLPICNPLVPSDCPEGQGCFPVGEAFQCAPDASGDMGGAGDPCQFVNACDPGNVCVNAAGVPGCAGAGCCTATCPIGDDTECLDMQECVPWYEQGQEPDPCLEGVGVCLIPG